MSAAVDRKSLERRAAARLELQRRKQSRKTVYGFYKPNGEFGGELVKCLQEQDGQWIEVDAVPDVRLAAKMEPVLIKHKRFKLVIGGRSSTKSVGVSSIATSRAKDYGDKTMCLRETQNTIDDSVHALLKKQILDHGWHSFEVTDKAIKRDGSDVFKFRGMRNSSGVKSAAGFRYSWVEEAQDVSGKSLEDLTPTIREAGAELWFTLNPQSSADPISKRFLTPFWNDLLNHGYYEDDLHLIVVLNYTDNPWHKELEGERLHDFETLSKAAYEHKWLGRFNDDVDNAIITAEMFDAAIDAHEKLGFKGTGAKIAAYDPSDEGEDDKGYCLRHGSVVLDVAANDQGDVNEGTDWALDRAINSGADWFVWDGDGLGIGLKRQVDDSLKGKRIDYRIFKGSETAENPDSQYIESTGFDKGKSKTNRDTFKNKRAQYYIWLRDRFAATYRAVVKGEYIDPDELISISSEIDCIEQLRAEVCRIPLKPNGSGKIQILSKVEMAKKPYELPSPNLADSLMMSMFNPPAIKSQGKKLNFKGWG